MSFHPHIHRQFLHLVEGHLGRLPVYSGVYNPVYNVTCQYALAGFLTNGADRRVSDSVEASMSCLHACRHRQTHACADLLISVYNIRANEIHLLVSVCILRRKLRSWTGVDDGKGIPGYGVVCFRVRGSLLYREVCRDEAHSPSYLRSYYKASQLGGMLSLLFRPDVQMSHLEKRRHKRLLDVSASLISALYLNTWFSGQMMC